MKSKRQAVRESRKRQNRITAILAIAFITLVVIVIASVIVIPVLTPPGPTSTIMPTNAAATDANLLGEAIPPTGASDHIADNVNPNPYSSNPPSSGHHYQQWLNVGFYDGRRAEDGPYPEGHLVHNLEHGYIIFWYNCKILSDSECTTLKNQIKAVMDEATNFKVIAYPWESIDVPVVLTSWGYRLSMKTFDAKLAKTFIDQHRNRAPEPNTP